MTNRMKELIAIGASVAANCQPCLEYHVAEARQHGAGDGEIGEAIAVGKTVRRGAAGKMDKSAARLLKNAPSDSSAEPNDSGCKLT